MVGINPVAGGVSHVSTSFSACDGFELKLPRPLRAQGGRLWWSDGFGGIVQVAAPQLEEREEEEEVEEVSSWCFENFNKKTEKRKRKLKKNWRS